MQFNILSQFSYSKMNQREQTYNLKFLGVIPISTALERFCSPKTDTKMLKLHRLIQSLSTTKDCCTLVNNNQLKVKEEIKLWWLITLAIHKSLNLRIWTPDRGWSCLCLKFCIMYILTKHTNVCNIQYDMQEKKTKS